MLSTKFKSPYSRTRITGTLHEDQHTFLIISRSVLLRMRTVSANRSREINTHFCFQQLFFPKIVFFYEIMWQNYCTAGQAPDDNMGLAHCMLDTEGYKHTLRICNIYCFSIATAVA